MTEIQTIEGGQKDVLLRRANIKKLLYEQTIQQTNRNVTDFLTNKQKTKLWIPVAERSNSSDQIKEGEEDAPHLHPRAVYFFYLSFSTLIAGQKIVRKMPLCESQQSKWLKARAAKKELAGEPIRMRKRKLGLSRK